VDNRVSKNLKPSDPKLILIIILRLDEVAMPEDELVSDKVESKTMRKPNRLISEKSPYLLQHAHNPVDWRPWSEEGFELAEKEDKLVFLSVGYSTCHWCHVMAHESFEDAEVAGLMNDAFVSIKVDREERPDIDQVYMKACQMMTGRGGWPLTIIMTPDKKPVFAATYMPKESRFGTVGLKDIIARIQDLWKRDRGQIMESAANVLVELRKVQAARPGKALDESSLADAYYRLSGIFDPQNGGFGSAPKFPAPHNLMLLLRCWKRGIDTSAMEMVETTLQAMRRGGIYDHVGFGFHRYSTDAGWLVPHFEKMLYDQALLALAYAEAYQATRKEEYASTVREVLEYVLRGMTSPEGGFYSAEDADSEGEEGKFYLWTAVELKNLLNEDEMKLVIRIFDISESGNFEKGRNILRLRTSLDDAAMVLKVSQRELKERLEMIRQKLFQAREKRVRPLRDDKVLADWNGLMIAAFARGAQILDEPRYANAARNAADFILEKMRKPDGRLLHRYRDGAGIAASLDDYAFLVWGLIELYETVFDVRHLQEALKLNGLMLEHFWDDAHGGLFFTPDDGETLLVRQTEIYDGAMPSGNSVAMLNLLRLSHLTGKSDLEEKASAISAAFAGTVGSQPLGHTMFLTALDFALGPSYEVALVGIPEDAGIAKMLKALRSRFLPNKAVIVVSGEEVRKTAEFTQNLPQLDGIATAYVCANYSCELPTDNPDRMIELLMIPKLS
jgi:uncharacterized protein YyaL (SSP411 family)